MGEDTRLIELEIEQTREHMGDTVQALADKADVPSRVRRYAGHKKETIVDRVSGIKEAVYGGGESVSEAGHEVGERAREAGHQVGEQARHAGGVARENPLGLAVGAAAIGFLAGTLAPRTRFEDGAIGETADHLKDRAREIGESAIEHGQAVAGDAVDAAVTTARDSAEQHTQELRQQVAEESGPGGVHV